MQAQLKDKQDVSATFSVTVPAEVVDATFERVLGALSRQVKVPGFRPGRAPRGVLIQRVGADALAEEVREALVDEHYPQAVRELDLLPVHAHFHGEAPTVGTEYSFEVHADLYPIFELPDFDTIELDASVPEISDDDVQATIERLREEHATLVPVERPIEAGDVLTVETLGEGGGSNMPVDLGRTEPHLVEQLTGRSMGEEITLDLGADPTAQPATEGADAADETSEPSESAAQDAAPRRSLAIRIVDVKAKELPDTDDAFAATLGFETWDATLAEIRSSLASQADRDAFTKQRESFVDQLMAATEMGLPKSMVARRQRALIEELKDDLEKRGMTLQRYLEELETRDARSGFDQELHEAAERAVKRDLVLEAVLERVGTEIGDAEFEAGVRMMAMRERKDVVRFKQEMGEEWLRNYRFLLNRDRAVREAVAAKTGRDRRDGSADVEEAVASSAAADAGSEARGHHAAEDGHEDDDA